VSDKKIKIIQILSAIETGKAEGDYSNVSIFNDGPGNCKQVTYGKTQMTEFGNLPAVIKEYYKRTGKMGAYVGIVGGHPTLANDDMFIEALKIAGDDPVMQLVQEEISDDKYWGRARKWYDKNGFTEPLSMLVIYDSYVHSGQILSFLRKRFAAKPPAAGGDEKEWISQYVSTRHNWLATHKSRPILRKTIYRTKMLRKQIIDDNWDLNEPVLSNGILIA
tara:strand:+ start:680 stop:1339 length:660 start_codon:yes stop_codon:yes gene_type:complete